MDSIVSRFLVLDASIPYHAQIAMRISGLPAILT